VFLRDHIGPASNGRCHEAVFSVNVDGTDLEHVMPPSWPVLSDGVSARGWTTRDGRIVFIRWSASDEDRGDLWIVDADGENATPLQATVAALTAAGCTICPYPVYPAGDGTLVDPLVVRTTPAFERFWTTLLFWQPVLEVQQ
jgi:hypothetical protein